MHMDKLRAPPVEVRRYPASFLSDVIYSVAADDDGACGENSDAPVMIMGVGGLPPTSGINILMEHDASRPVGFAPTGTNIIQN
jgi:hypothetical protein